jgi:hypothetical protein
MRYMLAVLGSVVFALTMVTTVAAGGPNSVFIDADNDCASPDRQVSSLPPSPNGDQIFYVWLNTGSVINSSDVYQLNLVPLNKGGTTLVGTQPVNFNPCPSSTWAYAQVGYGGFNPGNYAWQVFDPSNKFLGADTVKYQ